MADWPLIGRGDVLRHLHDLVEDSTKAGVVLAAPAGVGKTRVAAECLLTAERAGIPTLRATGTFSASGVPLAAVGSMVSALGGSLQTSEQDPPDIVQRLVNSVLERATSERLFFLVDDAHLLDNLSATLVHQLALSGRVFVLATLRARERAPELVTALWKDGLLERIDLAGLDPHAVERLLMTVLGGSLDGATLATLTAHCQGNVLFLRELVLGALSDGSLHLDEELWRLSSPLSPSDRLVELVEVRLGRLRAEERKLLELAAIGEPLGTHELMKLSDVGVAEGLEEAGLLTSRLEGRRLELRLAHPIYGEVLRSRLTGLQSRRLARSLAESVEERGARRSGDALRIATWRLTGGGGDPQQLLDAARVGRLQYDVGLSERLAEAAVASGAGFDAEVLLAELNAMTGRQNEASQRLEALATRADTDRHRAAVAIARLDLAHLLNRPDEMRRIADEVEAQITDPDLRADVAARRAVADFLADGPRAVVEKTSRLLPQVVGDAAIPVYSARAAGLMKMGRIREAIEAMDCAQAGLDSAPSIRSYRLPLMTVRSEVLANAGKLREACRVATEHYESALEGASQEVHAHCAWQLSRRYIQMGRVRTAARYAQEAIAHFKELGQDLHTHDSLVCLAIAQALQRQHAQARSTLETAQSFQPGSTGFAVSVELEAQAWTEVAAGDLPAACATLRRIIDSTEQTGDLLAQAYALHDLVRVGHAADAIEQLESLVDLVEGPWIALCVQHARSVIEQDSLGLEAVSRAFAELDANLLAAEAAGHAATAWHGAQDPRQAARAQNAAARLLDRCEGASTPAVRGVAVKAQLTHAEQETAALAASGQSNKAIAAELNVSVRTVEARLHQIYGKLGISHRAELGGILDETA